MYTVLRPTQNCLANQIWNAIHWLRNADVCVYVCVCVCVCVCVFIHTGLFETIVGVLTTCHTQYT